MKIFFLLAFLPPNGIGLGYKDLKLNTPCLSSSFSSFMRLFADTHLHIVSENEKRLKRLKLISKGLSFHRLVDAD